MSIKTSAILPLLLLATLLPGQTLDLSLAPADPANSFNTGPTGPNANLTNIVRTEGLSVTLTATPTVPTNPPAQLAPRRVALWVGSYDPVGSSFPEGTVFIGLTGTPMAFPLFDSFSNPFAPIFGPPLSGPSNTISLTIGANLFDNFAVLPIGGLDLVMQAITEDIPGGAGLILSAPARFQLINPELDGFAPTITNIATVPATTPPQGPETGGTVLTISGTNFLAQSNWASPTFAPTVTFGGVNATSFTILDNNTIMAVVPPTPSPTAPPATDACPQDVVYTNNALLAPMMPTPAVSPVQFLYKSGQSPAITGFDTPTGSPEGGYSRQIQGSWFLDGLTVSFTSQANPSLAVTLAAPIVLPAAGGTIITVSQMPTFCTGPVDVVVNNCDLESSAPFTFTYDPLQPTLVSGTPTTTAPAELGGVTYIAINEIGTALTLTGTNYLEPTSPLASASTVPPGTYIPTRLFVDNAIDSAIAPTSPTTLTGTTTAFSAFGTARPQLGFKELRVENPPCVNIGNQTTISNPPCAALAPPCTAVLQDANPPTVTDVFPAIGVSSGNQWVEIRGDNFFSLQGGVLMQDFSAFAGAGGAITLIDATSLVAPAVQFGTRFADTVEILDEQTLRVRVPAAVVAASATSVVVTVHNPDLQRTTAPANFVYVPPITNPTDILDPMSPDLDPDKIKTIAMGGPGPIPGSVPMGGLGPVIAPAITIIENPSPNRDAAQDHLTPPPGEVWSYDYVILFNTRLDGASPAGTRRFAFQNIDLPRTIDLPQGGWAFRPPIDPTLPALFAPGSVQPIPAGTRMRVIVKAFGFRLGANNRIIFDPNDNPPFVLTSQNDIRIDAMVDLAGDAFMIESYLNAQGAAVGGPFRVRVDRTIPPAGAGQGGRGGAFFPEGEVQLPGPNFGVGPGILAGMNGFPPPSRYDVLSPNAAVQSAGTSGTGAAPIGVQSGAGGGAGYVDPGTNGASGTSPGGSGGLVFGNATGPLPLPLAAPADDRLIFGSNAIDFTRFADGTAFDSGTLYGGSGGGGGGGGLAIFIPALSLGGRGGNGGGCLVMLSNRLLILEDGAAIFAQGEQGQLGVDEFPVYNADPVIPVNLPGGGGSGSGGTVLGLAVANVCFRYGPSSLCFGPSNVITPPSGLIQVDASGPDGGPQLAPEGLQDPGVPVGGKGSDGRIRFAISDQSPYVADFTTELDGLFTSGLIGPQPPMVPALPPSYFAFPLP